MYYSTVQATPLYYHHNRVIEIRSRERWHLDVWPRIIEPPLYLPTFDTDERTRELSKEPRLILEILGQFSEVTAALVSPNIVSAIVTATGDAYIRLIDRIGDALAVSNEFYVEFAY